MKGFKGRTGFTGIIVTIFFLSAQIGAGQSDIGGPPLTSARLCIHNGGEAYLNSPAHGFPNQGGGKYFPSFTHWTSTPKGKGAYPWKIRGFCWSGMQANLFSDNWHWEGCLQMSMDNPYADTMSFDYPALFCTGQIPHTGAPMPIFGGPVPTTVPGVSGNLWTFPSSMGGFDANLNIVAAGAASWVIPSTRPFYAWDFAFEWNGASAMTVPSAYSIWEHLWTMKGGAGFEGHYLVLSNDEVDCMGAPGNKGRCYSIPSYPDGSYFQFWKNGCDGVAVEWAMCLLVCDAVTIPVNVPGSANRTNPFTVYGFDVGVATITPRLSSGCVQLGFMTEDGLGIGGGRIVLAALAGGSCVGPYGKKAYRVPHGVDALTYLALGAAPIFVHHPAPGYPGCMYGLTRGAHSAFIPFPSDPALLCAEIRYSTFAMDPGMPMSASYMATYF